MEAKRLLDVGNKDVPGSECLLAELALPLELAYSTNDIESLMVGNVVFHVNANIGKFWKFLSSF